MIKVTPADVWFGRCVKERVAWTCERCGKVYNIPDTQGLNCSHFIGRRNHAVRFEPLDAFAHCYGCHTHFHENPDEFVKWVKAKLGVDLYEQLLEISNDVMRGKQARRELKEIAKYFESEYNRMLQLRAEGVQGRLDFVGYF